MPVVSSYFSKLRYIYSLWVVFHCFVALKKYFMMYLRMLSITLIQRSVHMDRAEPYTNVLGQSFAISNMFIEEEKS